MRCPKCNYISFDHLVTCEKCGRDLTEIASQMHGTMQKAEAPLFLASALEAFSEDKISQGSRGIGGVDNLETGGEIDFAPDSGAGREEDAEPDQDLARKQDMEAAASEETLQDEDEFDFQMETESGEEVSGNGGDQEVSTADQGEAREATPDADTAGDEPVESPTTLEKVSLDFEGLDMSDLSPEESSESEDQGGEEPEEAPFDLWSLSDATDGDDETIALFEDIAKAGKGSGKAAAAVSEEADPDTDDK